MIDDPYKELGIDPGASPDDIKRAYRRKAKEYHPDLHPNDPHATEKMNRINEAYDMLTHPEKYQARRAQQQAYQNPFQGAYQSYQNPYQNNYQQTYQNGSSQGQGGQQYYDPFADFATMFGFGGPQRTAYMPPREQPDDSPLFRMAVRDINAMQFQAAVSHLTQVVSTGRNARWYYLSALAEKGLGNTVRAMDHIQRAVQLEPNNQIYHQILNELRFSGQQYQQSAANRGFNINLFSPQLLCLTMCLAPTICNCLCGGGGYYYGPMR